MKKVFALVLVSMFALVIGCGSAQPAADTTTVEESATVVPDGDAGAGDAAGSLDEAAGAEDASIDDAAPSEEMAADGSGEGADNEESSEADAGMEAEE